MEIPQSADQPVLTSSVGHLKALKNLMINICLSLLTFLVLGTVCLAGRVLSVSARDGFNAVQIDDTSALYTLFDYKHSDINVGDYIKAHGAVKKASKYSNSFEILIIFEKSELRIHMWTRCKHKVL